MKELWHFTCKHGQQGIGRYGLVIPRLSAALGVSLSWFTDNRELEPLALGLTSYFCKCDRMEFLYSVLDADDCEPFLVWARRTGNPMIWRLLDDARRPEHWFVSERPVRVRQVRSYVRAFQPVARRVV